MQVKLSQISIRNFRIGDNIEDKQGNQYRISDVVNKKVMLDVLAKDEQVRKSFLAARVNME